MSEDQADCPMKVTVTTATRGSAMVWSFKASGHLDILVEAIKLNVPDWQRIDISIGRPEGE